MSARGAPTTQPKMMVPSRPSEAALFEHQFNHPATLMAKLHSDSTKISPTWTKVSSTPWEAKAILVGGYGRKMKRTAISSDAPTDFVNPETVPPPTVPRMTATEASITRVSKVRDPLAMAAILPGGYVPTQDKTIASKFRTFPCGKQVLKCPTWCILHNCSFMS